MARGTSSENAASSSAAIDVVNLAKVYTRRGGAPVRAVVFTAAVFGDALWALHRQE